jgi:hypothetical protein
MKASKEALRKPASELDPRARYKEGFNKSLEIIQDRLRDAFQAASRLGDDEIDIIKEITLAAARWWIDMGTQRCRLFMVMPDPLLRSDKERVEAAKEGTLKLTLKPRLEKHGDAQGKDLEEARETLIEEIVVDPKSG